MWYGLAPEVEREGVGGAAEHTNEVVLPRLEGLLRDVAAMVIWGHKLVCHVCLPDLVPVRRRDLVVEDLMGGDDALESHAGEALAAGKDEFAFGAVLHGFNPGGATVDVEQDHLVVVTAAGLLREAPSLIRVDGGSG